MKKYFLVISFLLTIPFAFSQNINSVPLKDIQTEYIKVNFSWKNSKAMMARIDYGQESQTSGFKYTNQLKDESGEPILFNSKMDILNYFFDNGYELFQAVEEAFKDSGSSTYLILRKKKE